MACTQPAPVVDEERLARRVVALLRREGLVVSVRDGGAPTAASDETSEGTADEPTDEPGDDSVEAVDPTPVANIEPLPAALRRAARVRNGDPDRPRALRTRIDAITPTTPAVITGTGDDALVWFPLDGAALVGPDDASVTVVTFVDPQCPFSARLLPMLRTLQRAHPQELRLAVRHRPLDFHSSAWGAAVFIEFARAARGSEGLLDAYEQVFAHPRNLDRASFDGFAQALGLDALHLADALDAADATDFDRAVARDDGLAESGHVNATPTSFFNGHRVAGAVSAERLEEAFTEALARARRLRVRGLRRGELYDAVCRTPVSATPPRRIVPRAP
jgi:protein-disulfide isomerase